MAESENTSLICTGSISIGSAEDVDQTCDPCLSTGQHFEAHGFCVDCKEYLCQTCFNVHTRTRALRHHQLLDKDNIDKHGVPKQHSNKCTERCSIHSEEVIKYFCLNHKKLGCHDCVILHHADCKLDYIPEKCSSGAESLEYKRTLWLVDMKLKELNYVAKKATDREKAIEICYDDLVKDLDQFEKEMVNRIHQIRKGIEAEIDKKKSEDLHIVKSVFDSCTNISAEFKTLQSRTQVSQTRKHDAQTYIEIKRAQTKLTLDEIKETTDALDRTNMQYTFEPNKDLQKLLSQNDGFGKLSLSPTLLTPRHIVDSVTHEVDINVRTKSDCLSCWISGCAVLSSNRVVLADNINNKLKVIDTKNKCVIEEYNLSNKPLDIAALPNDQLAVTIPDLRTIRILKSDTKLITLRTLAVRARCYGITYHQDYLIVVCNKPNCVVIMDVHGQVHNTILLQSDILKHPWYIDVGVDSRHIYISDLKSKRIVSVNVEGKISAVFYDLHGARGMLMLPEGSLLVCCDNSVHYVSGDLKQRKKVLGGIYSPLTICYNDQLEEIYVGGYQCDQMKVYSVKRNE